MSAVLPPQPALATPRAAWSLPLLALALAWAGLLLVYRDTAAGMVGIWARSDTFAHGFLVLPISLWLVWRGRDRLAPLQPRPSPRWLLPLLLAAAAWLVGALATVNALTQFALVAMLVLAVPLTLGEAAARVMLFPLLFLFFGVPVGEFLLPTLMEGTADFTVAALRFSGVPVYREGLNFMIPSGNWSVVEACSGVRYLIASLMVGSLFAYLNYRSLRRRLLFVGVAILVPIVANWVRAYMIVMLGHLSNNRIATGVDHLVYGWVFFGVVIMLMFMIGARWSEPDRPRVQAASTLPVAAAPMAAARWLGPALGLLAALWLPGVAQHALQSRISTAAVALPAAWQPAGGWQRAAAAPDWQPHFVGAAATQSQRFQHQGTTVDVFIAYYRDQGEARKLVSSVNALVESSDRQWSVLASHGRSAVPGSEPADWRVSQLLSRSGSLGGVQRSRTAWQTYWVDDHFTAGDVDAKLRGMLGLLQGHGDDGAVLVLHAEGAPGEGGDAAIESFVRANLKALRAMLREARAAS